MKQSPRFDLEAGENDRVMQLEIKIVWFLEVVVVKRFSERRGKRFEGFSLVLHPLPAFAIPR